MTATELVRTECANHLPDGGCLGMDIAPGMSLLPLWRKAMSRCAVAEGRSCGYFETALLAGIPMIEKERKAMDWQQAEEQYNERRHKHERGSGKGSMERRGDHGAVGLYQEAASSPDIGRQSTGHKITARVLRLSGRRRPQLAGRSQNGVRCVGN